MSRISGRGAVGSGVALCAAATAALWLPWWEAVRRPVLLGLGPGGDSAVHRWTGVEVAGTGRTLLVAAPAAAALLCFLAVLVADRTGRTRPTSLLTGAAGVLVVVAGAAAAASAGSALAGWGHTGGIWAPVVSMAAGGGGAVLTLVWISFAAVSARRTRAGAGAGAGAGVGAGVGAQVRTRARRSGRGRLGDRGRTRFAGRLTGRFASRIAGRLARRASGGTAGRLAGRIAGLRRFRAAVLVGIAARIGAGAVLFGVLSVPAPALGPSFAGTTAGPYVGLAHLRDGAFRSGPRGLPASVHDLGLTVVAGRAAVATPDGLVAVDRGGRAEVLARLAVGASRETPGMILGVAGDRVAWSDGQTGLLLRDLATKDTRQTRVTGVAEASRVGTDGSIWLRALGDPAGAFRRLDVHTVDGVLDARELALISVPTSGWATPGASALLPVHGGALAVQRDLSGASHLVWWAGSGAGAGGTSPLTAPARLLVGGTPGVCGLTSTGVSSHLPGVGVGTLSPDQAGGVWFAVGQPGAHGGTPSILAHVNAEGELRTVGEPAPGTVVGMLVDGDGTLVLAVDTAGGPDTLWTLPNAADRLGPLPPPAAACLGTTAG